MPTYAEALRWLYRFTDRTAAPAAPTGDSLAPLRSLLARLGDPQNGRRSVHITGSKGKGSTAAMIEALLRASGASTGLFTSPHLHHETERIRLNGAPIEESAFVRLVALIMPHVDAVAADIEPLSTFDLRTALAFCAFREADVAWQVLEVGIGGRLDSTNVLDEKDLCVFTPISLEHTALLGDTVQAIAGDKAGILRSGTRAVMSPQRESAADVLRERCAALGVPLEEVATACKLAIDKADMDGQRIRLQTSRGRYSFELPLLGRHQAENAATALLAVENIGLVDDTISAAARAGFAGLRWPGRLEILKRRPFVVVDGAHTPDSARRLTQALRALFSARRTLLIAGLNADKDVDGFAGALAEGSPDAELIACPVPGGRGIDPAALASAVAAREVPARVAPSVEAALEETLAEARPDDLICVTGSLYLVAAARAWLLGILPDGVVAPASAPAGEKEEHQ